jgi:hypothetical protein
MQTLNIKIPLSNIHRRKNFSISLSVTVNNKLVSKRYFIYNSGYFSVSDNQFQSSLISVPSLLRVHSISRSFLDRSSIISRLILVHFSIAARWFLDHRSLYRTRSVVVASMYRRSGCTHILLNILTNIPYGFLKPIPQYFPRPPD